MAYDFEFEARQWLAANAIRLPGGGYATSMSQIVTFDVAAHDGVRYFDVETAKRVQYTNYLLSMMDAYGIVAMAKDAGLFYEVDRARLDLRGKLKSIDFLAFKMFWQTARQLCGLQGRLLMEQMFWQLGADWKTLVTGFKPI